MKHSLLPTLASVLLAAGGASSVHATQLVRWEHLPVAVPLVVGQERVVFVDHAVRVRVPADVGSSLRVQSAGGAVYLRASRSISSARLELQDVDSGAMIPLDIAAKPGKAGKTEADQAAQEPLRIVGTDTRADDGSAPPGRQRSDHPQQTPTAVVLTRYAAQSLYAPLRTVEPVPGLARVNLRRDLALDTVLAALPIHVRALAAWRLDDEWVTALRLTNTSVQTLSLDPRALQGDFVAAAFQHPTLGPAGQSTDTTVVYLVTRGHGLAESLLPAMAPIDASVNLPPAAAAGQKTGGAR